MVQAPQLCTTASLQVPTHARKVFPSANMSRSEASNQINVSPGRPIASEPRTRVLVIQPGKVCRAGRARTVVGPAKTAICQEVTPHIHQQVTNCERSANGEKETSSRLGDIVNRLIAQNARMSRDPGETHPQATRRSKQQKSSNRMDNVGNTGVSEAVPNAYKSRSRVRKNKIARKAGQRGQKKRQEDKRQIGSWQ